MRDIYSCGSATHFLCCMLGQQCAEGNEHVETHGALPVQALRKLVGMGTDNERLELLGEAARLLQGLPAGAFPRREAAWLLTTAWYRGCHHAKFGRSAAARALMEAALALLPACPELQPRQEVHLPCRVFWKFSLHLEEGLFGKACRVCTRRSSARSLPALWACRTPLLAVQLDDWEGCNIILTRNCRHEQDDWTCKSASYIPYGLQQLQNCEAAH